MRKLFVIVFSLSTVHLASCQSAEDVTRVHKHLQGVISPYARPAENYSAATAVCVSFHLMSINEFDTASQKLTSNGWLLVTWKDDYLKWDPSAYGGVTSIFIDPSQVWRPGVAVRNTMKDLKSLGQDYVVVMVQCDGTVQWYPAERFETACQVDVTYFPFDTQTCGWEVMTWDNVGVDLVPATPDVDLSFYASSGEWDLVSTNVTKSNVSLKYEVTFKRRPWFLVITALLPIVLLAFVSVFVFTVPAESDEKVSYAITTLMSFGVFLSFIVGFMPSSSQTLSVTAMVMSAQLILSSLYALLTILTLRMFHRDDDKYPVPGALRCLVVWLGALFFLGPPSARVAPARQVAALSGQEDTRATGSGVKSFKEREQAMRKMAYTTPDDMTWKRVSRSLDSVFFRLFFLVVVTCTISTGLIVFNG